MYYDLAEWTEINTYEDIAYLNGGTLNLREAIEYSVR